jgi:hypothetical protein
MRTGSSLRVFLQASVVIALLAFLGCTALPKVELTAYTTAYSEARTITNGILDIVVPYERAVIRTAARGRTKTISVPVAATIGDDNARDARAEATLVDESLLEPKSKSKVDDPPPEPKSKADASLLKPKSKVDESLLKPKAKPDSVRPKTTTRVVTVSICNDGYGGPDPFCYQIRDAFADIGDPPLVASFRKLSNVVHRFNALLIAYANGVSGPLIEEELSGLSATLTKIGTLVPSPGSASAAAFASRFNGIVSKLIPVAQFVGPAIDRAQLRAFLLENYELVDDAIELMATSSGTLYANVAIGTGIFARGQLATTSPQALFNRQREIRGVIANWTVLLDDTRLLLRELKIAIENSDGLETRLRNLNESTVTARIDTSAIKKQIAALGTPAIRP